MKFIASFTKSKTKQSEIKIEYRSEGDINRSLIVRNKEDMTIKNVLSRIIKIGDNF